MRALLLLPLALAACTPAPPPNVSPAEARTSAPAMMLYDFSSDTDAGWFIVNDGVMGGRSQGHLAHTGDTMVFDGTLVTQGGGFTAARVDKAFDVSGMTAVEIVVTGDGRTYEMELSDDATRRGEMVSRRVPFETTGERQTVRIDFADLRATVFGEPVNVATFEPAKLAHLGIFMADGQDGDFRLEVESIRAVE